MLVFDLKLSSQVWYLTPRHEIQTFQSYAHLRKLNRREDTHLQGWITINFLKTRKAPPRPTVEQQRDGLCPNQSYSNRGDSCKAVGYKMELMMISHLLHKNVPFLATSSSKRTPAMFSNLQNPAPLVYYLPTLRFPVPSHLHSSSGPQPSSVLRAMCFTRFNFMVCTLSYVGSSTDLLAYDLITKSYSDLFLWIIKILCTSEEVNLCNGWIWKDTDLSEGAGGRVAGSLVSC